MLKLKMGFWSTFILLFVALSLGLLFVAGLLIVVMAFLGGVIIGISWVRRERVWKITFSRRTRRLPRILGVTDRNNVVMLQKNQDGDWVNTLLVEE